MNSVVITITSDGNNVEVSADYSPDYPDDTPAADLPSSHQLAVMLMGSASLMLGQAGFAPDTEIEDA